MSLINDALKRAQENPPPPPPPPRTELRPVHMDHTTAPERNVGLPIVLMAIGLLCIIVFVGFASFKGRKAVNVRARALPSTASGIVTTHPPVQANSTVHASPVKSAETNTSVAAVPKPANTAEKCESPKPAQAKAAVVTEKPLKLQSIVFSQRPSAMISGSIVAKGETIRSYKVTNIEADKVTLSGAEGTIILTLE